jgi:ketosteroid isomerase-like protein
MHLRLRFIAALGLGMSASAIGNSPGMTPEECKVWQRESDFARSVEQHDLISFASFISPDAVFNAGAPTPLRGRRAIVEHWTRIVSGAPARLSWRPNRVILAGNGNLAYSSGPYALITAGPDAKTSYLVGDFATIWARTSAHAEWFVVFDSGTDPKSASSEAEALAHLAHAQASCP